MRICKEVSRRREAEIGATEIRAGTEESTARSAEEKIKSQRRKHERPQLRG